jgi:hypothetical protein
MESRNQQLIQMMQATKKRTKNHMCWILGRKLVNTGNKKFCDLHRVVVPLFFLVFVCVVKTGSRYRCGSLPECTSRLPYFFLLISWFLGDFCLESPSKSARRIYCSVLNAAREWCHSQPYFLYCFFADVGTMFSAAGWAHVERAAGRGAHVGLVPRIFFITLLGLVP